MNNSELLLIAIVGFWVTLLLFKGGIIAAKKVGLIGALAFHPDDA